MNTDAEKTSKRKPRRFFVFSFLGALFGFSPVLLYVIASLTAAALGANWVLFYGAVLLLYALMVTAPVGGAAGIACGITALCRRELRGRSVAALILSTLVFVLGCMILRTLFSRLTVIN